MFTKSPKSMLVIASIMIMITLVVASLAQRPAQAQVSPTATPGAQPDLVVISSTFSSTSSTPVPGGCVVVLNNLVSVVIGNQGSAAAGVFEVAINGLNLRQAVPSLAVGATVTLSFSYKTSSAGGTVVVDSTGLVAESNETNNTRSVSPVPTGLPPVCTPTAGPSPTPTTTNSNMVYCGYVRYNDAVNGAGMVGVPILFKNTRTPVPYQITTTGAYGKYCAAYNLVNGSGSNTNAELNGFTFSPDSYTGINDRKKSYDFAAFANGVPTYTPTPGGDALPDLIVTGMAIQLKTGNGCYTSTTLGVRASVKNQGMADAGAFEVDVNGTRLAVSGLAAGATTDVWVAGYVSGGSSTATADAGNTVAESDESNNTRSQQLPVPTLPPATCTPTGGPTNTPTPTLTATRTATGPTPTRTRTPTRTNTPVPPTVTRTLTAGTGTCSPVTSTITAPFTYDGAGTFCWQASTLGTYLNSWNVTSLKVNGTAYTNVYVAVSSLPAKINGYWYISYVSTSTYGHFEAK